MMEDEAMSGESTMEDLKVENERLHALNGMLQIEIDWVKDENEQLLRGTNYVDENKLVSILENEWTCVICDGLFIDPCILPCGHTFCEHCISQWLATKQDCPVCRERCMGTQIVANRSLTAYIDRIFTDIISLEDLKKRRINALKEREEEVKKVNNEDAEKAASGGGGAAVGRRGRPRRQPRRNRTD